MNKIFSTNDPDTVKRLREKTKQDIEKTKVQDVATAAPSLIGPAVHNAIGKWVDGFPITPDMVLKALGKA